MIPTAETRVFARTSKRNETEKKQCGHAQKIPTIRNL
jgi:hypothetical protein